jgi:hypothetical protein
MNDASIPKQLILLPGLDGWQDRAVAAFALDQLLPDGALKAEVRKSIAQEERETGRCLASFDELTARVERLFAECVAAGRYDETLLEEMLDFARRKKVLHAHRSAYRTDDKPNPNGVFWPDPLRDPERSLYTTLPYVHSYGIITPATPVGTLGCCFSSEFAYYLQERGFNFVITEPRHQPDNGVFEDPHNPRVPYAQASANWGGMTSSASFRQLAEKVFGERQLPRVLGRMSRDGQTWYVDPFREHMFFASPAAYEADYDRHIAAARAAFLRCQVLIITLGLNEYWEFIDGELALSRNLRHEGFAGLVRYRILSVAENVYNIQRLIDLVRAYNPGLKFIMGINPGGFKATVRGHECHVLTAYDHGKSVLRVAFEEIIKNNHDVYYLPSAELIQMAVKEPWGPDHRHLSAQSIERARQLFDVMFIRAETPRT